MNQHLNMNQNQLGSRLLLFLSQRTESLLDKTWQLVSDKQIVNRSSGRQDDKSPHWTSAM